MKQPAPDLIVAGKYCLERQLAAGGMGSVWVARHLDLDRDIAIKFMDPECASEEGFKRFELEAKAAFHLQSPYVVNVLDYGVDDDLPYIVMELLDGEDLEDRLQRVGRISLPEAQKILAQAAKGLRRAQELGIIHRDIKPHNLFLSKDDDNDETLKILDFGIAKEMGPALVGEGTNTGHIVGSPNYMSPEHVRGAKDIDHRSDLWSLGVVIFQAVTGRLPFPGDVVGDVIGMILADPIPRATEIAPDLPPEVDDFFFKALQRDRSLRFQSAREMSDAFVEIVARTSLNPGARVSMPNSTPAVRVHRADAPTLALDDDASKSITSQVPNEDTLAKNAVVNAKPAARRSGPPWAVMAAASAVLVALTVLIIVLRGGGQASEGDPSANVGPEGVVSASPGAAAPQGQSERPSGPSAGDTKGAPENKPASAQQPAATKPATSTDKPGAAPAGQGATAADTPPPESTAAAAPTHVGDTPAFGLDDPAPSGGSKAPTKPGSKPTTKTGGTSKTPTTTPSTKPSWGF